VVVFIALHLRGFPCGTHMLLVDMCFISFIVCCSLVVDISTATNKWKWPFYRSELQRRKYMEQKYISKVQQGKKKKKKEYGSVCM